MKIGLDTLMGSRTNQPESADFDAFMEQIKGNVPINAPLFLVNVDTDTLWDEYIFSFPYVDRQEYNCNCCKSFIKNYGALVYIDAYTGEVKSALWDISKDYGYFNYTVNKMRQAVEGKSIDRQFFSKDKFLGRPIEGGWTHLSIPTPEGTVTKERLWAAYEVMAQSKENFRMLNRALDRHREKAVNKALVMLRSDQLFRPEKILPQAEWFSALQDTIKRFPKRREAVVWAAVSSAPKGFCNINSSAFGSLVEDINDGLSDTSVKKRFNQKMDPLLYRRPQSDPGAQNIKRGEEIIAKLGLERSLARRYAKLEDLRLEWRARPQKAVQKQSMGVFGSVKARGEVAKQVTRAGTKPATMTFAKFEKKILPHAESIQVLAPNHGSYSALCTAVHADAPNLLQWNNPVNWYVYGGGSSANQWGVRGNTWINVTGVALQPNMWDNECEHQGESAFFLLEGCRDSRNAGLALFPEILKSELHEIRKTIESYSSSNKMEGRVNANACGIKFGGGAKNLRVRVVSKGVETEYLLDRMD